MDDSTLSVTELNRAVAGTLRDAFPETLWVRGEIQRLVRSKPGHCYFDLVDKDELRDRVRSRVRVALFRDDRRRVERSLRNSGVELRDDVEVRLAARVGFYAERGEFQLVMHAVDPTFTVGQLAAQRDRLLNVLAAEGLLRANRARELTAVPLRVGLVSSGGTAAYHDVVHELENSGIAWRVVHVDVRVQGNVAARRLGRAVREVGDRGVDVIVLVRGGGARTDLAAYDSEPLARAIAAAPVPVFTGIGHETDRSVADEVAHSAHKTPTACAWALVEHVRASLARTDNLAEQILRAARERVVAEQHRLLVAARHAGRAARGACALAEREVVIAARRAGRGAPSSLRRSSARLHEQTGRVPRAVPSTLRRAEAGAVERTGRLARAASRRVGAAAHDAEQIEARLRALDPRRVLERGYTITRDRAGRALRAAGDVAPGDLLLTEFADGTTESRVEET